MSFAMIILNRIPDAMRDYATSTHIALSCILKHA